MESIKYCEFRAPLTSAAVISYRKDGRVISYMLAK